MSDTHYFLDDDGFMHDIDVKILDKIVASTRKHTLREVRDAIDATYETSVSLKDFDEKLVTRLDHILALFRAGGKFEVEE